MRRDKYVCWLLALLLTATGCEDFLNKDPQDEISKEQALGSLTNLRLALNGAYSELGAGNYYGEEFIIYADLAGGNAKLAEGIAIANENDYRPVYNFNLQPGDEDADINNTYAEIYRPLNAVNNVINAVPDLPPAEGTPEEREQILGEALALRALLHFDLLRLYAQPWGFTPDNSHPGIVLLQESPLVTDELPRSTVAEGYALVVADLEQAISLLQPLQTPYFFSAEAARALLARVMLYQGNWGRAAGLANEVIDARRIELATTGTYPQIWQPRWTNTEFLLRLDQGGRDQNLISNNWGTGSPRPSLSAASDLLELYAANDVRGPSSLLQQDGQGNWLSGKYPFLGNQLQNQPILRLSEVYLTRAEALAELNRPELALEDLNTIRLRANPQAGELQNLSGQTLIDSVLAERRRELALEGHLLFDLSRKQQGVNRQDCQEPFTCSLNWPDNRFILPIPQDAIFANRNLRQNEGY